MISNSITFGSGKNLSNIQIALWNDNFFIYALQVNQGVGLFQDLLLVKLVLTKKLVNRQTVWLLKLHWSKTRYIPTCIVINYSGSVAIRTRGVIV